MSFNLTLFFFWAEVNLLEVSYLLSIKDFQVVHVPIELACASIPEIHYDMLCLVICIMVFELL